MKRICFVTILLVGGCICAKGQDTSFVAHLRALFVETSDQRKDSIADISIPKIKDFLASAGSKTFDFKSLKHVGVLKSPDNAFTMYFYNIKYRDGSFRHFGFVQVHAGAAFKVIFLNDKRAEIERPMDAKLSSDRWFGALYYQIIPIKLGQRKVYTLLGTSFNNLFTTKKVIDVLELVGDEAIFGAPIFFDGKRKASRVIFEHSARYAMTLRYMADQEAIVFDHLVSSEPNSGNDFQFFGPDGSQDGFVFENQQWVLRQKLDVRMPNRNKKKEFKTIKTY